MTDSTTLERARVALDAHAWQQAYEGFVSLDDAGLSSEDLVRLAIGPRFEEALRLAERAAACFPQSLYAGVDILLDHGGRPLVGEINAFGDLLPRLTHNGESAYGAIARMCDAASAVL